MSNRVKYTSDFDKSVLLNNFENRGWTEVNSNDDWNFYWCAILIGFYNQYILNMTHCEFIVNHLLLDRF